MNFEQNLFISYAHLDNQSLKEGETGWVDRFHKALESMLGTRLGRKAKIWRDKKLQGNDVFTDEIVARFQAVRGADVYSHTSIFGIGVVQARGSRILSGRRGNRRTCSWQQIAIV